MKNCKRCGGTGKVDDEHEAFILNLISYYIEKRLPSEIYGSTNGLTGSTAEEGKPYSVHKTPKPKATGRFGSKISRCPSSTSIQNSPLMMIDSVGSQEDVVNETQTSVKRVQCDTDDIDLTIVKAFKPPYLHAKLQTTRNQPLEEVVEEDQV